MNNESQVTMKQTILGSGGSIGIELAKSLAEYTTNIRLVSRNPKKVHATDTVLAADLTRREEVFKAVEGSDITYVVIGFPYDRRVWEQTWIPFAENVTAACFEYTSKLVFFDNVYSVGAAHVNHITEDSPVSPTSRKGDIRAEVNRIIFEKMENGLEGIIARAPDFFGGTSRDNSMLINLVYNNLKKGKKAQWFCNAKAVHTMGYVPDLARGTAILGNTPDAYNQIWNLPTDPERVTGEGWINLFAKEMDVGNKYTVLPQWLIKGIGLFVPVMKELAEMNYQFNRDYYFDSSKFNTYFEFTPTPNAEAVRQGIKQLEATGS